jgi:cytochrome P450 family 619
LWAFEFLPGDSGEPDVDPATRFSEGFLVAAKDYELKLQVRSEARRDTIIREFEAARRDIFSKFDR